MSDLFISYSKEDRPRAKILAHAIEKQGWSVWWDRFIPAGKTFDEVIEKALDQARCVIVLWSAHSVKSRWVRTEAAEGAERGILVPVLIEDVRIPLAFRRIQAEDLINWDGSDTVPGFRKLVDDIANILGPPPSDERKAEQIATAKAARRKKEDAQRMERELKNREQAAREEVLRKTRYEAQRLAQERKKREANAAKEERQRSEAALKASELKELQSAFLSAKSLTDLEKIDNKLAGFVAKNPDNHEARQFKRQAENAIRAESQKAKPPKPPRLATKATSVRPMNRSKIWLVTAGILFLVAGGSWYAWNQHQGRIKAEIWLQKAKQQAESLEAERSVLEEKKRAAELAARRKAELEAQRKAELAARRKAELEKKRLAELAAKQKAELEKKRQAELAAKLKSEKTAAGQQADRSWLGVNIQDVTAELAKKFGLKKASGALVADVQSGSPAEKAGIKKSDIIVAGNRKRIETSKDLVKIVSATSPGKILDLKIFRNGVEKTVKAKIEHWPAEEKKRVAELAARRKAELEAQRKAELAAKLKSEKTAAGQQADRSWLGVNIQDVTAELAKKFGLKKASGALVADVQSGSPAEKAGIKKSDIIVVGNRKRIETSKDLVKIVSATPPGKILDLKIFRNGVEKTVKAKIEQWPADMKKDKTAAD